ncbi:hypothetical protein [Clostridium sp.]|uniref:hypothetical protein n=1 Tax=Clostridium sp. TaxID=1506 RepID=UPI003D6D9EE6
MYNWTKEENEIVDIIFNREMNGEISFDKAADTAENYGISDWSYKSYSFDKKVRLYNEDFYKYIGKVKKEYLDDKFEITEEEKKLLRENPDNSSLMKAILDNLQRKRDIYEIKEAKYYYKIAKVMMKYDHDDETIKKILRLTDEAIKEIRNSI